MKIPFRRKKYLVFLTRPAEVPGSSDLRVKLVKARSRQAAAMNAIQETPGLWREEKVV